MRQALALLFAAIAIAGCGLQGLQPGKGSSHVSVTVTRDFGTAQVGSGTLHADPSGETVMGLLQRFFRVQTGYGGGFVEAIDGVAAGGVHRGWFYYVNGVQEGVSATGENVHPGERVWWDVHDTSVTQTIPAVVGSFPEPFVHGINGTRYPTTLECAVDAQAACNRIGAQLRRDGVPVADQLLGTGSGSDSLNIVVATWSDLHGSLAGDIISHGPKSSGIYAKFVDAGHELQLLNPQGAVVRTLGAGAGLVAATHDQVSQPEWLVTGTDVAGVLAAAAAVTPTALHDRFALAVLGSRRLPIPIQASQ
ncbi:MAG TPA: DUF4430 domain-containing protein [Solirubrobacteraceae bacterium]|jgi:hypothetical protein|nr:DUF4430 domain-containing protein [Solirubrobacteraceae bacterium]